MSTVPTVDDRPHRSCAVMSLHRDLLEDPNYRAARGQVEDRAAEYEARRRISAITEVVRIPVVVHVVHHTPEQNISEEQIRSQIAVLNEDFRAVNLDVSTVPEVWRDRVADARVEFQLATTDPTGAPTNGITRTQTTMPSFPRTGERMKSRATGGADPWPRERYLNIWVCQVEGVLGYAQFPGGPARTDGVVVLHSAFGTTGTARPPFNRGRTTTHEVGHWLNVFHIWGDDGTGCTRSDMVADTPNQASENYGCPTFPKISCGNGPNGDMFMNFMDYTDDACMVLFTKGQVARMHATLEGPRASLLAPTPTLPGGSIPVLSRGSGRGLDVSGASSDDGAPIIQWEYAGGANQRFRAEPVGAGYYRLVAEHSGACLEVQGASGANGAPIVQGQYRGAPSQQFRPEAAGDGYFKLVARHSGKVLDVATTSTDNGAQVIQWDWWGGDNQKWRLGHAPIIAKHSGRALDVAAVSGANGAAVLQWDWWGGRHQRFRLEPVDDGWFRLVAEHSGKCLDVEGGSTANAARLIQWDWWGGENQQFRPESVGDGTYRLVARHSGKCLDVARGSRSNRAQIIQFDWRGGDNQRWRL